MPFIQNNFLSYSKFSKIFFKIYFKIFFKFFMNFAEIFLKFSKNYH